MTQVTCESQSSQFQENVDAIAMNFNATMIEELKEAKRQPLKIYSRNSNARCLNTPSGESTTLGRLMKREGISIEIKSAAHSGIPLMGTYAGFVLLSKYGD